MNNINNNLKKIFSPMPDVEEFDSMNSSYMNSYYEPEYNAAFNPQHEYALVLKSGNQVYDILERKHIDEREILSYDTNIIKPANYNNSKNNVYKMFEMEKTKVENFIEEMSHFLIISESLDYAG